MNAGMVSNNTVHNAAIMVDMLDIGLGTLVVYTPCVVPDTIYTYTFTTNQYLLLSHMIV